MESPSLITRIDKKLLLLHIIAAWFLAHSFYAFALLGSVDMIEVYRNTPPGELSDLMQRKGYRTADVVYLLMGQVIAKQIGLIFAILISFLICRIKRKHWINAVLVLVIMEAVAWIDSSVWNYTSYFFWWPGRLFAGLTSKIVTCGTILALFSALVFLLSLSGKSFSQNQQAVSEFA